MLFSSEFRFLLAALTTWRLTHLLVEEDGPWDIVLRLRVRLKASTLGKAMDCFYCSSLWIAVPITLAVNYSSHDWVLTWLAISGASCLLERATRREDSTN